MIKKIYLSAAAAAIIGGSIWLYSTLFATSGYDLYLSQPTPFAQVRDSVSHNVGGTMPFTLAAYVFDAPDTIAAGYYKIERGAFLPRVARRLAKGRQTPVDLVLNNIRTPHDLAEKIAAQTSFSTSEVDSMLSDPTLTAEVGFSPTTIMAMFIPDSYQIYWYSSPEEFFERMRHEYDSFWNSERLEKARLKGLSPVEVMTLASIVSQETNRTDEMPTIAGVYLNRLRIGMPLQADPTVKYALGDFSIKRIMSSHLQVNSPYNTYRHRGLPPSPIAMPSKTAINAVLDSRRHSYIYFCASPSLDGSHRFASTYNAHLVNAKAYARALNSRNIK